jgi:hypothetical protein
MIQMVIVLKYLDITEEEKEITFRLKIKESDLCNTIL